MTNSKKRRTRATTPESQETLKASIIDAACKLFNDGGYEAVTMRNVAQTVGCTAGALYRYFPDKHSLLLHVWEEDMRYASSYIQGAVDLAKDPVDKIRQAFLSYLRYWQKNRESFRILFGPSSENLDRSHATELTPSGSATTLYYGLRERLAELLKDYPHAPKDADLATQILLTAVHGIIAMHFSASQFPWFNTEEMARASIDSILSGWRVIETPTLEATPLRKTSR